MEITAAKAPVLCRHEPAGQVLGKEWLGARGLASCMTDPKYDKPVVLYKFLRIHAHILHACIYIFTFISPCPVPGPTFFCRLLSS